MTPKRTSGRCCRQSASVRKSAAAVPFGGFTLIELLVTIAIILLLAALSVPVIGGVLANARKASTTSTIKKVDELLKNRIQAFNRYIDEQTRDRRPGSILNMQGPKTKQLVLSADPYLTFLSSPPARSYARGAGSTGSATETLRAMVLSRKGNFRKFFPQNWDEFTQYGWAGQLGVTVPTSPNATTESAEVLYLMLTRMGIPGFPDDADDVFLPAELADTDGNGFMEIVDSWGHPLRFYRWPTSLFRMAAGDTAYRADAASAALMQVSGYASKSTLAGALNKDLDDPRRTIPSSGYPGVTATNFAESFHTISTFSLPLVVSAGLDGNLGLQEPGHNLTGSSVTRSGRLGFTLVDATNGSLTAAQAQPLEDLFDNVTNLNITAGRTK